LQNLKPPQSSQLKIRNAFVCFKWIFAIQCDENVMKKANNKLQKPQKKLMCKI